MDGLGRGIDARFTQTTSELEMGEIGAPDPFIVSILFRHVEIWSLR